MQGLVNLSQQAAQMNSASHLPKQEQLPTLLLLDSVKPNAPHTSFLVSINFPLVTIAEGVPASGTSSTTISVRDFRAFLDAHLVEYSSAGPALPSDFLGRPLVLSIATSPRGIHHHTHIDSICICFDNQELCRLHHDGHNPRIVPHCLLSELID